MEQTWEVGTMGFRLAGDFRNLRLVALQRQPAQGGQDFAQGFPGDVPGGRRRAAQEYRLTGCGACATIAPEVIP
jgi:hypothetical protein